MEFLNKSKNFGSEYDMHGVGSKKRYEEAKATITKLEEELDTLQKGKLVLTSYGIVLYYMAGLQKFQSVKKRKIK